MSLVLRLAIEREAAVKQQHPRYQTPLPATNNRSCQVFQLYPEENNRGVQTFSTSVPPFLQGSTIEHYPGMYSEQISRINDVLLLKQGLKFYVITFILWPGIVLLLLALLFYLLNSPSSSSTYSDLSSIFLWSGASILGIGTVFCSCTWRPGWVAPLPDTVAQVGGCMNLALLTGGRSALPLTQRVKVSGDLFVEVKRQQELSLPSELGSNPIPAMAWRVQYTNGCNFKMSTRSVRVEQINIYWDRSAPTGPPVVPDSNGPGAPAEATVMQVQQAVAALNDAGQQLLAAEPRPVASPVEESEPFSITSLDDHSL